MSEDRLQEQLNAVKRLLGQALGTEEDSKRTPVELAMHASDKLTRLDSARRNSEAECDRLRGELARIREVIGMASGEAIIGKSTIEIAGEVARQLETSRERHRTPHPDAEQLRLVSAVLHEALDHEGNDTVLQMANELAAEYRAANESYEKSEGAAREVAVVLRQALGLHSLSPGSVLQMAQEAVNLWRVDVGVRERLEKALGDVGDVLRDALGLRPSSPDFVLQMAKDLARDFKELNEANDATRAALLKAHDYPPEVEDSNVKLIEDLALAHDLDEARVERDAAIEEGDELRKQRDEVRAALLKALGMTHDDATWSDLRLVRDLEQSRDAARLRKPDSAPVNVRVTTEQTERGYTVRFEVAP